MCIIKTTRLLKETVQKLENALCLYIGINFIKMILLPKAIYCFTVNTFTIPKTFFRKIEQIIQNSVWSPQRLQIMKATLIEQGKYRDMLLDFKLYYKAIVRKIV